MPYVNVKITREGATAAQKAEIIAGVTGLLVDVLDKDPATTFVVIEEVDLESWGVGGVPTAEYRRRTRVVSAAAQEPPFNPYSA
ncbi:4-oxalocrotonate tautomerase family protein [Streptomyces sp. NBC_00454]|uniref:tautomerase family protein n=1 Tax=Streptomyces sp. NBC_00454 TaxID=2975747 RepID=UPI0030DEB5BB